MAESTSAAWEAQAKQFAFIKVKCYEICYGPDRLPPPDPKTRSWPEPRQSSMGLFLWWVPPRRLGRATRGRGWSLAHWSGRATLAYPSVTPKAWAGSDCRLRGDCDLSRGGCLAFLLSSALPPSSQPYQNALFLGLRAAEARRRQSSARRRKSSSPPC